MVSVVFFSDEFTEPMLIYVNSHHLPTIRVALTCKFWRFGLVFFSNASKLEKPRKNPSIYSHFWEFFHFHKERQQNSEYNRLNFWKHPLAKSDDGFTPPKTNMDAQK